MRCEECGSKDVVKVKVSRGLYRVICKTCGANVYYEEIEVVRKVP